MVRTMMSLMVTEHSPIHAPKSCQDEPTKVIEGSA